MRLLSKISNPFLLSVDIHHNLITNIITSAINSAEDFYTLIDKSILPNKRTYIINNKLLRFPVICNNGILSVMTDSVFINNSDFVSLRR